MGTLSFREAYSCIQTGMLESFSLQYYIIGKQLSKNWSLLHFCRLSSKYSWTVSLSLLLPVRPCSAWMTLLSCRCQSKVCCWYFYRKLELSRPARVRRTVHLTGHYVFHTQGKVKTFFFFKRRKGKGRVLEQQSWRPEGKQLFRKQHCSYSSLARQNCLGERQHLGRGQ